MLKVIKTLQPEAKIIESTFGDVPVSDILSTESFDYEKILNSPGWLKAMEGEEENEEEKENIAMLLKRELKDSSAFTAFKRWLIWDNEEKYGELEKFIPENQKKKLLTQHILEKRTNI